MKKQDLRTALALGGFASLAAIAAYFGHHDPAVIRDVLDPGLLTAMAVVQSAYTENIKAAYPGMIANEIDSNVETRNVETVAGIPFGVAVSQGALDRGVLLGAAAGTGFVGVTVRDVTLVQPGTNTIDFYRKNENAAVLLKGDIWATVGGNVVAGGIVTFNNVTGVLSSIAVSGTQFLVEDARWLTTATSGNLAIARLTGKQGSV